METYALQNLSTHEVANTNILNQQVCLEVTDDESVILTITHMQSSDTVRGRYLDVVAESAHPDFPTVQYVFCYKTNQILDIIA